VVEGRVRFIAGRVQAECGPGAVAYLPAGLAHAFQSLTPEVRLLIGVFPGGIETYFHAIGEPAAHMGRPPAPEVDVPHLISLGANYGLEFLPPGMTVADHRASVAPGQAPVIRSPGDGPCLNVLGVNMAVSVAAAESDGAVSVFVSEDPKLAGPPLHVHRNEDETFFVLEGDYRFQTGDMCHDVGQGDFAYIPRGVAHTYARISDSPGRLLIFTTPGGFEAFFSDIDALCRQGPPEIPALTAIGAKHGVEFVGPPIGV
jgi:quercetin dioxygenase-like cupin family protein